MTTLSDTYARVEQVAREGTLPIVVFDLDSTLFDTAGRNRFILQEFAAATAERWPRVAEVAPDITHAELGWEISDPLRARGFEDAELLEALDAFWFERFFTSAYTVRDLVNPGAVEFVQGCHRRGALVYYLTGRHVGGMDLGTAEALRNAGFPYWRGRAVLHLKPTFHMSDEAFKQQALAEIRTHFGTVVATFENEPGNAHLLMDAFPEATHYLFGSVHSPKAPPPRPELVLIEDFHV